MTVSMKRSYGTIGRRTCACHFGMFGGRLLRRSLVRNHMGISTRVALEKMQAGMRFMTMFFRSRPRRNWPRLCRFEDNGTESAGARKRLAAYKLEGETFRRIAEVSRALAANRLLFSILQRTGTNSAPLPPRRKKCREGGIPAGDDTAHH